MRKMANPLVHRATALSAFAFYSNSRSRLGSLFLVEPIISHIISSLFFAPHSDQPHFRYQL